MSTADWARVFFQGGMITLRSILDILPVIWPFLLLALAPGILRLIGSIIHFNRLRRAGMPEIDRMDGEQFERKLAILFREKGYKVERTPYQGDWGADLVISKGGRRAVVQAKRWNRKVNPKAVQEIVAAKAKYGCDEAMVVTNSIFTRAARELARANGVELWDRDRLARELLAVQKAKDGDAAQVVAPSHEGIEASDQAEAAASTIGSSSPAVVDAGTRSNPKCFKCGREMVLKEGRYGPFWACPGFPECRNTFPARVGLGTVGQGGPVDHGVSSFGSRRDRKRR